jgi:hypothetical protein
MAQKLDKFKLLQARKYAPNSAQPADDNNGVLDFLPIGE